MLKDSPAAAHELQIGPKTAGFKRPPQTLTLVREASTIGLGRYQKHLTAQNLLYEKIAYASSVYRVNNCERRCNRKLFTLMCSEQSEQS